MLTLSQLLRVPHVDSTLRFDISPDGQRLVFAWNKTGRWELYEMPLDKKNGSDSPQLVSQKQGSKFSPIHSPDGTMLAYALDLDGSESYHIIVHDLSTHISRDLTPQIAYAHQPNITWSPDGKVLAVLSDKHGQFALHLIHLDGTPGRMIKNVFHPCWDAKWSPDGQWIAIEAESTASDRSIYVMPVNRPRKGVKVNTVQLKVNGQLLNAQQPAWSPDSKFLAFSGENGEWHDIGLFNVESKEITWVNESTGDDTQPAWSRSGEIIGWVHSEGAKTSLQLKEGSDVIREKKIGDGVHYFPQFTDDSVVILYEDTSHPCDLWKINLKDNSIRQLTNSLPDDLRDAGFIQPEEVWYTSKDGTQVPALLYRAKDSTRGIIDIHGGPNWLYQFLWSPMMSHLASRGWTVLAPNYRGSTGYGKKWQNASRYDMGGVDTDDCAAGVNYLIENNLADKNKIAVTGRSHGGFLTMSCMTRYPELFAVGSAVVPFLNWIKSHKDSREDLQHWNIENMGDPEDNHDRWVELSPYFFLDKVNAPVQMICGGNDPRCPASDSIDARDKLVELGKEVELLIYKDEGHAFLDIENVIDSEEKCVEFIVKNI
ncbi:MAG: S9 family peptidase [Anaerolineales bacterium]|uniref:S9 family peptidase n=1 Tax=Candidatus Villigracilis proximus TaxID=3140683 RepID=UPI003136B91A|nr:S9 family peptidase [Anaerolineales bacterium]